MNEGRQRVAVTGLGAITALGVGVDATFDGLIAGRSGIGALTAFGADFEQLAVAAEIKGLRVSEIAPAGLAAIYSRADALALVAAAEAIEQARASTLDLSLALGTTGGGVREATPWLMQDQVQQTDPALCQSLIGYPLHATAHRLAERFATIHRHVTFCSACSSSATAIAQGAFWISRGQSECVLAGGTEALSLLTLTGFAALGATSREACRPFDAARCGMTLGEAAAFLVLESESHARARGAEILAWLDGWSLGAEAHHVTQPEPSGATAARLIELSLHCAGVHPRDVGYYNAHGTGTVPNDSMEASALRASFGTAVDRVLVSSAKGQLGHTLGAAGAVEALVTVLALRNQVAPPTVGLVAPAPDTALNHVIGTSRRLDTRYALSSSFGFGGLDVVLLFSHLETPGDRFSPVAASVVITAAIGQQVGTDEIASAGSVGAQSVPPERSRDPLGALDPERSRRFDRLSALACAGAERALASANARQRRTGLVVGNALGNTARLRANLARIKARGPRGMPPAEFPHLVHSSVAGNASIYNGLTGPVTSVSDRGLCCGAALELAVSVVAQGQAQAMIAGVVEALDDGSDAIVDPHERRPLPLAARRDLSQWFVLEAAEQARDRGQPILARIIDMTWSSPVWYQYLVEHRPQPRSCLVLAGIDPEVLDRLKDLRDWKDARRVAVRSGRGHPSGDAGGALLRALELLRSEALTEAVVICKSGARTWVIRLGSASEV
jgi:3-oxoacyl-[acyl-carrier-protein] synthase II